MTLTTGRSIGRYAVLEQLGAGGMATVYRAMDPRLQREVAVKVIRRETIPPEQLEAFLKRFEREARALAKLAHPNIVSVLDCGEQDGAPFLVMEYLTGGTLKQWLGKPIRWQDAARILLPVARALTLPTSRESSTGISSHPMSCWLPMACPRWRISAFPGSWAPTRPWA
jgi:eukaryotic-like serine/threonine-protein kinase